MNLTISEILEASGGQLLRGNRAGRPTRVCIDTRILQPGDLFVAITGDRFDGEDFVARALDSGAGAVLTAREWEPSLMGGDGAIIRVDDTVRALGVLAHAWRRRLAPSVIAITGSSGKTTTKDMTAHLCAARLQVLATEGNKNNHIGLPLTLLRLGVEQTAAVVELGMNHSGEIDYLARLADPDIGVLTNIGDAHLGNFPNHDALIDAKGELFAAMRRDATAIINADCAHTRRLRRRGVLPRQIVAFGEGDGAVVRAEDVSQVAPFGYEFTLRLFDVRRRVYLPVFGRYQVSNALAASAAALLSGILPDEIAERLATFRPAAMRSQVTDMAGIRVIEDCYNASPLATCAAIASFAQMEGAERRVLLLGDMAELGQYSEEGHRRVGVAAARAELHAICCAGTASAWTADEARRSGAEALHFDTVEEAAAHLTALLRKGDAILVKGSRLARMERAIELLREHFARAATAEATIR